MRSWVQPEGIMKCTLELSAVRRVDVSRFMRRGGTRVVHGRPRYGPNPAGAHDTRRGGCRGARLRPSKDPKCSRKLGCELSCPFSGEREFLVVELARDRSGQMHELHAYVSAHYRTSDRTVSTIRSAVGVT